MTLQEAAKETWTEKRAAACGYLQVQLASQPLGISGGYTKVEVLFTK